MTGFSQGLEIAFLELRLSPGQAQYLANKSLSFPPSLFLTGKGGGEGGDFNPEEALNRNSRGGLYFIARGEIL